MSDLTPIMSDEVQALNHVLDNVFWLTPDSPNRAGLTHFGITDIYHLMSINPHEDFDNEFLVFPDIVDPVLHRMSALTICNIDTLQLWFSEQLDKDMEKDVDWLSLDHLAFRRFSLRRTVLRHMKAEPTAQENTQTPIKSDPVQLPHHSEVESFQRSIKRSPTDYNKFKDDNRWKQWHRHLKATANSHGLNNILTPSYVPVTVAAIELFEAQQKFMYSVFEQCLLTNKSKHIVQLHETTWDAQKVYAGLIDTYEEDLSATLTASDLCTELTALHLDDKWKKGIEAFLQHWLSKVLELEQVDDSPLDNATKCQWLTTTLTSNPDMNSCICQTKVTEMTMLALGTITTKEMPWDNFFNIL